MSNSTTLYIKNMVCPRCIMSVKSILQDLSIPFNNIALGQLEMAEEMTKAQRTLLEERLQAVGFELLEPGKSALISKIKTVIIEQIHYSNEPVAVNFSKLISDKLHHEYAYLSRLFSSIEGITIEKYIARQKIEKVKELLFYDQISLSQISLEMNYSSVSYLSAQFKKETGMTPTQFKSQERPNRKSLDNLQS
ncbi:AraC family transcriptional regulator [Lentimicrobium sp.]|uniref:helix-turn-helix domain-containing protein n=1 Tax=Lentimicrobium sp. TaxID=2034841 RepID=UPI002B8E37F2|nr:AraC family transcriptional regulator [Lentimicrobium sp.]HRW70286.1 AraC family transcriptional regulator [Lentimicrobium sp.]